MKVLSFIYLTIGVIMAAISIIALKDGQIIALASLYVGCEFTIDAIRHIKYNK